MSSSGSLNILLIGSGGREHAIAWKISQSKRLGKLFVCPGNGGTSKIEKVTNVSNLNPNNPQQFQEIAKFCKQQQVDFVVVGPEQPLVEGIVETLSKEGISVFGPSKKAAIIEGSKAFSKDFMKRNNIPTAKYEVFTEFATALQYVSSIDFPIVVKASGLAAGKGVILPEGMLETLDALKSLMVDKTLQNAGDERLYGPEVSVLAFTDGYSISIMPPAQDHKRVFDDDSGPNTGGMGAYAPTPIVSKEFIDEVREKVFKPTIDGMRKEGRPYVGVLYAGLLLSDKGMQVLEFNCRFGDPETQAILPLLETDLIDIIEACIERRLDSIDVKWKTDCSAVSVVAASGGYPGFRSDLGVYRIGKYEVGNAIQGIEDIKEENVHVFHAGTAVKDGNLVTSGGRVLAVTAVSNDLTKSIEVAYSAISKIKFDKIHYRKDIAARALKEKNSNSVTYRDSGVDIDAGDNFVDAIKPFCKSTARPGSNADLGGFGGLFDLKATGIEDPVLVSGTDGVGTKLLIAQSIGKHDTIGIDLVAMNVNDVVVQGADPLFFLDYYACGKLEVKEAVEVVKGIAEGCRQAGCSLIGGETAEMPGMYPKGKYDLAGFAVGVVERAKILPNFNSQVTGDILLGLASSGIHSNGYSLVRRLVQKSGVKYEDAAPFQKDKKLGEVLLTPTKIYVKSCLKAIKVGGVKGMAHITGGGLPDNLPRALHDNLAAEISLKSWELPPVFKWLKEIGNVEQNELLRTFNCGIGMVVVVSAENAKEVERVLKENGEQVFTLGKLIPRVEKDHAVVFVE